MTGNDIRAMARRMERETIRGEVSRYLRVFNTDVGTIAVCRACPDHAQDSRFPGRPAYKSQVIAATRADAFQWFLAHRLTDIHTYYRERKIPGQPRPRFEHDRSTA